MFEPVASWSLPSHLYLVSAWSAECFDQKRAASCRSDPAQEARRKYVGHAVRLDGSYLAAQPAPCLMGLLFGWWVSRLGQKNGVPPIWNVLPRFTDVHQDQQVENVQPLDSFLAAVKAGKLPAVSWIAPNKEDSEHPDAKVSVGQSYVTSLVNAIKQGPEWNSTAIFLRSGTIGVASMTMCGHRKLTRSDTEFVCPRW